MIRRATETDILPLALLLQEMYIELFPDDAVMDILPYTKTIVEHLINPKDHVFVEDGYNGFFVIRDETSDMAPTIKRFNGMRVYIIPEHRCSSLLNQFYATLFEEFPDGDIIGVTELSSKHIPILNKRHKHIANMYVLNRS